MDTDGHGLTKRVWISVFRRRSAAVPAAALPNSEHAARENTRGPGTRVNAELRTNSCLFAFIRRFHGFQRQTQNETASAADARFIDHVAAVGARDLPDNRQPQARTLDATAQRIV